MHNILLSWLAAETRFSFSKVEMINSEAEVKELGRSILSNVHNIISFYCSLMYVSDFILDRKTL